MRSITCRYSHPVWAQARRVASNVARSRGPRLSAGDGVRDATTAIGLLADDLSVEPAGSHELLHVVVSDRSRD